MVVLGDEAVDGGLEVCEGAEHATLEPPPWPTVASAGPVLIPRQGNRRSMAVLSRPTLHRYN